MMATDATTIPLKYLDAGIRDVVAALWERALKTSDSGDGVSKSVHGIVLPFEHVAVVPVGDPDATMQVAADALSAIRPGQAWVIEHERFRTVDDPTIREIVMLYRLDQHEG